MLGMFVSIFLIELILSIWRDELSKESWHKKILIA